MIESKIPLSFWPEAIATAVYLLNRLPTKILDFKTPLDILSEQNTIPSPLSLEPRVFGCTVFVHIPKHERSKFCPSAVKCVFLGYGRNQKGYRCYDPKTRTMHTTMNCDFVEEEFFYSQPSGQGESQLETASSDTLSWLSFISPTPDPTPTPTSPILDPISPTLDPPQAPTSPVLDVGPPETVSGTAGPPNSNILTEELSNTPPSIPSRDPEVNCSDLHNSDLHLLENTTNGDREIANEREHDEGDVNTDTRPYELPRRNTRGVPP